MSAAEPEPRWVDLAAESSPTRRGPLSKDEAREQLARELKAPTERAQARVQRKDRDERMAEAGIGRYTPTWEGKGRNKSVVLAPLPQAGDHAGLCGWLTATFNLDPEHAITGGMRTGARSEDGIVILERRGDAPRLYFNPAAKLATAAKLLGALGPQLIDTDDEPHNLKNDHCLRIVRAVTRLCSLQGVTDLDAQARGVVHDYLMRAQDVGEGYTAHGTPRERWELVAAIRGVAEPGRSRRDDTWRYVVDDEGGETLIPVGSLHDSARRTLGRPLHHGELDGLMGLIGWERVSVDGRYLAGREGRRGGNHLPGDFYRGRPSGDDDDDDPVTR
jgi:hypothetical protein